MWGPGAGHQQARPKRLVQGGVGEPHECQGLGDGTGLAGCELLGLCEGGGDDEGD